MHETLSEKITKSNRTGGVAQVVEHLPDKCKDPSLNPVALKKKVFNKS
jgi:hypothetical protein